LLLYAGILFRPSSGLGYGASTITLDGRPYLRVELPAAVGLPFAVGAKAAKPSAQVICLHADGSFGQNAMQLDTAVRHKLLLLCVIILNGGSTADPERNKPGRDLGYTRYDKMAEALGCYAEYVEEPEEIRPALQRAWQKVEEGMVGFVNVKTDYRARATTVRFSSRET
jgi:thiamine pyrophosphate-dependent acetolactate synthase large subunit-like protein